MDWIIILLFTNFGLLLLLLGVCVAFWIRQPGSRLADGQERLEKCFREEMARGREENSGQNRAGREELASSLRSFNETLTGQLTRLTESNEKKLEQLRATVEARLQTLQEDNTRKLEQMRQTVDEKLQSTLERRLGESFRMVSERLEQVHKGLGEMQSLATGVGDLKKVLTNVKTRGTWGEVQLSALLEQVLAPDQYEKNVATRGEGERVEFAIKLPGRGQERSEVVWLPIDAKFPQEDYLRLLEAQEQGDPAAAEAAGRQLEATVRLCAKTICAKYLNPPKTTDFAILFLPSEGLYAEVVKRTGLGEAIQRDCRVSLAGPSTLWALLNSLQMGFQTLAIERRSSEVWTVLGQVKTEFGKYGDVLGKVQKKLQEASNTIDAAATRTRSIERRLRGVQDRPAAEKHAALPMLDEVETEPLLAGTGGIELDEN